MKLALVRLADNEIIKIFPDKNPRWFDVPGVGKASPPEIGWQEHGYGIYEVQDAQEPAAGKRRIGSPAYTLTGNIVVEAFEVENIPETVVLTLQEKFDIFLTENNMTRAEFRDKLGIIGGTV